MLPPLRLLSLGLSALGNNVPVYVLGSQAIPPALGDSGGQARRAGSSLGQVNCG
jgi:hypothetical protein